MVYKAAPLTLIGTQQEERFLISLLNEYASTKYLKKALRRIIIVNNICKALSKIKDKRKYLTEIALRDQKRRWDKTVCKCKIPYDIESNILNIINIRFKSI